MAVLSDRMARPFNRPRATRAVALDIFKTFDRIWHAGLLHKPKSYGISDKIFGFIPSFLSNRWLQLVPDGKYSKEHPVNAGVPQGSILGRTFFLLYINEILVSLVIILPSMLSVITDLICCNNENWHLSITRRKMILYGAGFDILF